MTQYRNRAAVIGARILLSVVSAGAVAAPAAWSAPPQISGGIVARDANVHGTTIHYLRAGMGDTTIVLLHGWPESSHEWHKVIPALSSRYTVIASDLRGVGGSRATATGYDKATLAEDVHALVAQLGLKHVYVIGHDIGGMVAYAYARSYPEDLSGVAIIDIPVPGIDPWTMVKGSPWAWHFGFNATPGLAEALVAGRQEIYFRHFFNDFAVTPSAISPADRNAYAGAYRKPESLRAGFEFYRAFPQDEAYNRSHQNALSTPILLVGGDHSGGPMLPALEKGLRAAGATSVKEAVIPNCGHWVAEEQPQALVRIIEDFVATK
ncbi:MAG TPA: alpha/beta hydrolase [Stellaceae bacterium]|nr:alpha/beta hydrolase [Stellaceae bacterium]